MSSNWESLFVDADRRVRYANPALLRIWGFGGTGENMLGVRAPAG